MRNAAQLGWALTLLCASVVTSALPPGPGSRERRLPPAATGGSGARAPQAPSGERSTPAGGTQTGSLRDRFIAKGGSANAQAVRDKLSSQMSTAQQQNLKQLQSDLSGIQAGSTVSQQQVQQMAADLKSCAQGATKPSQQSVQSLSSDLQAALADGNLTPREMAQLSEDVAAVLNSANISQAEAQAVIADAQSILTSSGVSQAEVQAVVGDLQAIAAELQANVPR